MALDGIIDMFIMNDIVHLQQRHELKLRRRTIRDTTDPFQLPNKYFVKMFRLSKDLVMYLVHELRPFMKQRERKTGVVLEIKVLGTLLFLAHGCYQSCVGDSFNLGLSQQAMSICIEQVTSAITDHLLERWVVFPQTEKSRNQVKQRFMQEYNFPGVIGAIDCTHVAIISPPVEHPTHPGLSYYNRKGFYSINVQLICDADLKILNCNPKFPGSPHDSAGSLSSVNRHLQQAYEEGTLSSSWLIGDSGYPLQPWLLTPIIDAPEQTPEGRYTNTHIPAKNCIERCNGVLKQRFRCLLQHRVLHYNPVKAGKIIYACVVLHNMTIAQRIAIPDEEEEEVQVQENNVVVGIEENLAANNWLADGRRIRNRLIMHDFIN